MAACTAAVAFHSVQNHTLWKARYVSSRHDLDFFELQPQNTHTNSHDPTPPELPCTTHETNYIPDLPTTMTDRGGPLKSTYKPSPAIQAPLPPGWTEHKAPTGHTYYYNALTKESTYKRPAPPAPAPPPPSAFPVPQLPNLSNPAVANAFLAQQNPQPRPERRERDARPKPQPNDKPKSREVIPGCEPWVLVYTKYGRRFVYHPGKGASYWRIPEKIMPAVLEMDRARVAAKAGVGIKAEGAGAGDAQDKGKEKDSEEAKEAPPKSPAEPEDDDSEYEEVEVTDDEEAEDDEHPSKRQRTDDEPEEPALTAEEELAMQLELMAQEQALEGADYEETPEFSEEDARELFRDLLSDYKINPYSPWDNLVEQTDIVSDPRYTVLPTTKARKEVWEEWSKERIREHKEAKAKEEKPDPRVEYMAFLEKNATPRLYWPEFKRKFRKEACMKSYELEDKERERWYREYVAKLKQPQATLKSDLTALLRSLPLATLNNATDPSAPPNELRGDARYVALPPSVRDPLLEAYIQSLAPPPGAAEAEESAEAKKAAEARKRREKALEERNRAVEEKKAAEERRLEEARRRLREGEAEILRAKGGRVGGGE